MKKINYVAVSLLMATGLFAGSCAKSPTEQAVEAMAQAKTETPESLNIRYVDMDSIAANYNLSRDLQEAQLRAYSRLDAAQKQKAGEIQKVAGEIQQKINNNGYLSEVSYNSDMQRVNKMQQDAESYLNNLQRNQEQELAQLAMQLQDSINSFINDYNATHGYDAILIRSAGLYFNPSLDITKEVIDGLNARYTKVAK
ncbi:MAG: OmpH family outer membrane protein [Muribaculaceae bacterium]|nr:OmpH family outer membrane protein [Muribaculaceae bacterium]